MDAIRQWLVIGGLLAALSLAPAPATARPDAVKTLGPIDRILVYKQQRRLHLMRADKIVRSYRIALGFNPHGGKEQEGDGRTPEGVYVIDGRNPDSRFHLSLRISYPAWDDVARAEILNVTPGGDIMIHGVGQSPRARRGHQTRSDWTDGCIAVRDHEIEEIWRAVADGTVIEIRP